MFKQNKSTQIYINNPPSTLDITTKKQQLAPQKKTPQKTTQKNKNKTKHGWWTEYTEYTAAKP